MSVFKYEKDADGIVTVTMDMTGPVNAMNEEYRQAMAETVDRLEAGRGPHRGRFRLRQEGVLCRRRPERIAGCREG